MDERDRELEALFSGIREFSPTKTQMEKWRQAVQYEIAKNRLAKPLHPRWAGSLAAALATGFLLGALSSKHVFVAEEKHEPLATIQYVYSNTD